MLSDTVLIALIAGIPIAITAFGTLLVSWNNLRESRKNGERVEANTKLTAEVKEKTEVISGHVNSAASEAKALNESQAIQLDMMRATIAKMETAAQLVAQAAAQAAATVRQPVMMPAPQVVTPAPKVGEEATTIRKLEAIEKHTEATAENTARTEESTVRTEAAVKKANEP